MAAPQSPEPITIDELVARYQDSLVMIGDQLQTDIAGANAAGIASALVATGVSQWLSDAPSSPTPRPDFLLSLQ